VLADTSYQTDVLVLSPRSGFVVGLGGSILAVAVVALLRGATHIHTGAALEGLARTFLPATGSLHRSTLFALGLTLHATVGGVFGLLYALCQQRVPVRGLVVVGIFYGFFLWVVARIVSTWVDDRASRAMIRSWPWLLGSLAFSLSLALAAVLFPRTQAVTIELPVD